MYRNYVMAPPEKSFVNFNEQSLSLPILFRARKPAHGTIRLGGGIIILTKL